MCVQIFLSVICKFMLNILVPESFFTFFFFFQCSKEKSFFQTFNVVHSSNLFTLGVFKCHKLLGQNNWPSFLFFFFLLFYLCVKC